MALDDAGFQVYKGEKDDKTMDEKNTGKGDTGPHMANFLAAVKSRKLRGPACRCRDRRDVGGSGASGNASYRVNRELNTTRRRSKFVNDKEADAI